MTGISIAFNSSTGPAFLGDINSLLPASTSQSRERSSLNETIKTIKESYDYVVSLKPSAYSEREPVAFKRLSKVKIKAKNKGKIKLSLLDSTFED